MGAEEGAKGAYCLNETLANADGLLIDIYSQIYHSTEMGFIESWAYPGGGDVGV